MPPHFARTWTCEELLRGHATKKYALIIVNQPIRKDLLQRAWQAVDIRLCADGGANRLFDVDHESQYLPDLIKGDLDSLRPDVQAHYASLKVPIKKDEDEYSTDLMKCIQEVPEDYALVLLGGLSGRVDQTVHTMSMLHKMDREIYVLDKESMAWVLRPGQHEIHIDHSTMGQTCGILPVGIDSAHVRTKGLKWDVGNLSTSNHLLPEEPVVWIETSRPILWTVEIRQIE
ncbi:thiamine pyrophosphokinase, putative [Cryptococcus deneoformans JEC21]|uniref:Thiamine pyrophosphokinase n=1 Tax=Cryptococcus deneoformans (strain JEC21 / ATCC MYA-565) TaxID=214684 RepID=Q5KBW1_CRYD1|nr:thiamine pyrophosphokinase, putative [Cryptococcus neoformans var. neoformans JEC21]AAW45400.1 thiamine pyrophosphokinase, putative [Cryptococcus neoformans var. neoformans JEC21]